MKPRPVSNPPNPWASTEVEYLDEIPPSKLEVLEDHSREVLASNNSPDVCFTWSINPLLRLPGPVKDVFEERLRAKLPLRAERVLHRIRETRSGELYDSRFKHRMKGEGLYAETIKRLFDTAARKVGIQTSMMTEAAPTTFRRPTRPSAQLNLF